MFLENNFRKALLDLTDLPAYSQEDKKLEQKDLELIQQKDLELIHICFQEDIRDKSFFALSEAMKGPIWVFEGRVVQTQEEGLSF